VLYYIINTMDREKEQRILQKFREMEKMTDKELGAYQKHLQTLVDTDDKNAPRKEIFKGGSKHLIPKDLAENFFLLDRATAILRYRGQKEKLSKTVRTKDIALEEQERRFVRNDKLGDISREKRHMGIDHMGAVAEHMLYD